MRKILPVGLIALLFVIYGCDMYEKDTFPQREYNYTIPTTSGSPTLINTRAYFNSAYQEGATYKIVNGPGDGKVSLVSGGNYFYYEPKGSSLKNDRFTAEIISAEGKRLAVANLNVEPVSTCGLGEVVTHVKISKNTTYTLNLLENDVFCNMNFSGGFVYPRDYSPASSNSNFLFAISPDGVTLTYTPEKDFTGISEVYYDLGLNPSPKLDLVPSNDWYYYPKYFEKYVSVKLIVEVLP